MKLSIGWLITAMCLKRGKIGVFSFAWPWLFVLLPLPLVIWRWLAPAAVAPSALKVPFYAHLVSAKGSQQRDLMVLRQVVLVLIWLLLLGAAANPRWLGEPQAVAQSSRDLILAVDISGSMETQDMQLGSARVNRLEGIKAVMDGFIERRRGDRLGLILFADNAYMQVPLTFDHTVLNRFLQEAQIGFAGKNTAIGEAIGLAVKRMGEQSENKVLILLTDGANTAGAVSPLDAAQVAAAEGLKIYTLGFGADEMLVQDFFSQRSVNPSQDLDEPTLRSIAERTGGRYFRARDIEQLVDIYQLLDELEPSDVDDQFVTPQRALFHWPLGAALVLSMLWALGHCLRAAAGGRR
ncbi:MAG: vWA domain-containing protein [Pseudomonadales bacterium]